MCCVCMKFLDTCGFVKSRYVALKAHQESILYDFIFLNSFLCLFIPFISWLSSSLSSCFLVVFSVRKSFERNFSRLECAQGRSAGKFFEGKEGARTL